MLTSEQQDVLRIVIGELESLANDNQFRFEVGAKEYDQDSGDLKKCKFYIHTCESIVLTFNFYVQEMFGGFVLSNISLDQHNDYSLMIAKYLPGAKFENSYYAENWRHNINPYFEQIRQSIEHPFVNEILTGKKWYLVPFSWDDYVSPETAERIYQDMIKLMEEEQAKRDVEETQGGKLAKIINLDIIRKIRNALK